MLTARDSLNQYFLPNEEASEEHLKLILGVSEEANDFALAKIVNEANTIAAIYTVRSLYDLFAQLVRSFVLADSLAEGDCNIHKVRDKLASSDLKQCIDTLLLSKGFLYVNAFANVSKHRYLVKFESRIDFEDGKAGMIFSEFEYRNRPFPAMWSNEILVLILSTKNVIIEAGTYLNEHCIRESV